MQTKARLEDSHILPRRRQERQQKQSNCLACVNQFSMAFATLPTDSVYNERKHPGKAGKEKQKTAPKKYPMILCNVSKDKSPSIQYYFAKYPCFVFLPFLPHPTRKTSGANRSSSFVMQRDEIIQDSKCAPLHHPARHGYTRSRQGAKSRRGCPENGTASC